MNANHITQKWKANIDRLGNHVCLGLDPDPNKLPDHLPKTIEGVEIFLEEIIASTKDVVVTYKANISFFEAMGIKGLELLLRIRQLIPSDVPLIIDAKRGDIGNTSSMQAKFIFDELGADATTLHPYMGSDSVEPFLEYHEKFNFILGLTSNPGSKTFEKLILASKTSLYQHVITQISQWNKQFGNAGVVVGATQDEMSAVRKIDPNLIFLIPGVGAQGGSYEDAVTKGVNSDNVALINMSRSLLYAGSGTDFAEVTRSKVLQITTKNPS